MTENALYYGKPKACSYYITARFFRTIITVENKGEEFRRNSLAFVGYFYSDTFFRVYLFYRYLSAVARVVYCVVDEVIDDLFDFNFIGFNDYRFVFYEDEIIAFLFFEKGVTL